MSILGKYLYQGLWKWFKSYILHFQIFNLYRLCKLKHIFLWSSKWQIYHFKIILSCNGKISNDLLSDYIIIRTINTQLRWDYLITFYIEQEWLQTWFLATERWLVTKQQKMSSSFWYNIIIVLSIKFLASLLLTFTRNVLIHV